MENGENHTMIYVLEMTCYKFTQTPQQQYPLRSRSAPNRHNAYLTLIMFLGNNMMTLFQIWETKTGNWSYRGGSSVRAGDRIRKLTILAKMPHYLHLALILKFGIIYYTHTPYHMLPSSEFFFFTGSNCTSYKPYWLRRFQCAMLN